MFKRPEGNKDYDEMLKLVLDSMQGFIYPSGLRLSFAFSAPSKSSNNYTEAANQKTWYKKILFTFNNI